MNRHPCRQAFWDLLYYSIPVDESSQKYLKFISKEQPYQFCVLPNRLSPCPRWFTKLLKPPLAVLRKLKHVISAYINDIYFQDDTKKKSHTCEGGAFIDELEKQLLQNC